MTLPDWPALFGPASLDETGPTPLYHQIYLILRDRIRSGAIPAAVNLPGEQELARMFQVSRITVKRALNELAADRLVTRHRGRGTVVVGGASTPVVKGGFDTLLESLRLMGLETEVELLEVKVIPAPDEVAERLKIQPGAAVQRAVRRRKLSGEPFSHLVTFVPGEIARHYSDRDLATVSLLTLLERAGAAAYEAEQWITAVAAEPVVASALGLSAGSPVLKIERIMRGQTGTPVQLIWAHYRPDRFQYHVRTQKRRGPSGSLAVWRDDA